MNSKIILSIIFLLFCRHLYAATSEIDLDNPTFAGLLVGVDLAQIGASSEKNGEEKFIKKKCNGRDARRYRRSTPKRAA